MSNNEFMIRRVAAEHRIDTRTLKRALRGERIRGADVRERVELALQQLRTATPTAPSSSAAALPFTTHK